MPTDGDAYEALKRKCWRLQAQQDQLCAELGRSREENANLRESSFLWLDLYERQLRRANELENRLERIARVERRSVSPGS
jgi:hypothetical protein